MQPCLPPRSFLLPWLLLGLDWEHLHSLKKAMGGGVVHVGGLATATSFLPLHTPGANQAFQELLL